jgi:hypothetical protein
MISSAQSRIVKSFYADVSGNTSPAGCGFNVEEMMAFLSPYRKRARSSERISGVSSEMSKPHETPPSTQDRRAIVLPLDRDLAIWSIWLCILSASGGLVSLWSRPVIGTLVLPVSGLAVFVCVRSLRPNSTYLTLDEDGLTRCVSFKKKSVSWADIRNIRAGWLGSEPMQIQWNKRITIEYCRNHHVETMVIAPRMFGVSADELMVLISSYRERSQQRR